MLDRGRLVVRAYRHRARKVGGDAHDFDACGELDATATGTLSLGVAGRDIDK
jgi:hypothetical protein